MGITSTHLESVWNLSGPSDALILQTNNWSGFFFEISYSQPALTTKESTRWIYAIHWRRVTEEE